MSKKLIGFFDTKKQTSEEIFQIVQKRMKDIEREREEEEKNKKK